VTCIAILLREKVHETLPNVTPALAVLSFLISSGPFSLSFGCVVTNSSRRDLKIQDLIAKT